MGSNKQMNHKWAFYTGSCLGESIRHATSLIPQVETKPDFLPLPVILTPQPGPHPSPTFAFSCLFSIQQPQGDRPLTCKRILPVLFPHDTGHSHTS